MSKQTGPIEKGAKQKVLYEFERGQLNTFRNEKMLFVAEFNRTGASQEAYTLFINAWIDAGNLIKSYEQAPRWRGDSGPVNVTENGGV